jgi:hypothetical protein
VHAPIFYHSQVPPTWIEFSPGETIKDVIVEVIPSPSFDGTVEFGLYIIESSVVGAQVCQLSIACAL